MTVTLPEDVVNKLKARHSDLGWAIVELVEAHGPAAVQEGPLDRSGEPVAELVQMPNGKALIAVHAAAIRHLPSGVTLLPLANGRALLEFHGETGLADLELSLVDRLATLAQDSEEYVTLSRFRDILRSWRCNRRLRFSTKSIIVVEGMADSPQWRMGLVVANGNGNSSGTMRDRRGARAPVPMLKSALAAALTWVSEAPCLMALC